jgi:hypothetical protein
MQAQGKVPSRDKKDGDWYLWHTAAFCALVVQAYRKRVVRLVVKLLQ